MKYIGLTSKEAKRLLKVYGYNQIDESKGRTIGKILWDQIKGNFMIYFMILAAVLSFGVAKSTTGYSIMGVIFIIVLVGFFQEYKAEKAVSALKNLLESFSIVLRDANEIQIPSRELVPGDIVLLETGERVPADAVILESKDLIVNESILTGESKEISKKPLNSLDDEYKQQNLVFMGTYIVNGRGVVKILKTGMDTEFGKIASMISAAEKELPLKDKVNRLVKFMAIIAVVVSLLSGAIMLLNLESWTSEHIVEIVLISIALMISAFPEGMPVVLITTLAGGAYKMAKRNAIVNRMSIIETLGETTVICSDKTGTITKGEMTVKELFTYDHDITISGIGYDTKGEFSEGGKVIDPKKYHALQRLLQASVLCNNAHMITDASGKRFKGTPTEIALVVMGHKANIIEDVVRFERIEEVPFNSDRKMMSVVVEDTGKKILYSKGAPEFFIEHCTHVQVGNKVVPLNDKELSDIWTKIGVLTDKKYRVLCVGYKELTKNDIGKLEDRIIFLGGVALQDVARDGVKEAVQLCYNAGIKVKMITGDNKDTAIAIAKDVGIVGEAITGDELDTISDEELTQRMPNIMIFARVKPEHKIRIVQILKNLGEIVTMTGDGVNDAPALKEAHIGVAMGLNGTDVSREAADLVLKDDNFVTIVHAIEEGRIIFKNIQKFVIYQLSCNIAELSVIFISVVLGFSAPLIAIQILFMNLVTDNLPALTLGFTKGSGYVMQLKARKTSDILNTNKKMLMIGVGLYMAVIAFIVYVIALKIFNVSLVFSHTLVLLTMIMFEISNAFNFRSLYSYCFKTSIKRNMLLVYASIVSLLATAAIIYIPFLQKVFQTQSLPWYVWIVTFLISLSVILVVDFAKHVHKHSFEDYGRNE